MATRAVVELDPYELPIVVACRRLLADTAAQLPLVAVRDRRPLPRQPSITARPNPLEYRWLTIHRAVNQLTRHGYCWLFPTAHDGQGRASALRVVDASDAMATWDPETGDLDTVWYLGQELVPQLEILWVPYDVEERSSLGAAPLTGCWRAVRFLAALWSMAGSFWEAGYPSVAIQVKHRLQPGQAAELKQQVLQAWHRAHEPAVIDNDGTLAAVGASPLEAQLVESIQSANAEVARAFGMPPSLVNVQAGDSLTYATTESEFSRWLATGLGSYLMRLEAAWTDLLPAGVTARFDSTEFLRNDFAARVNAYQTALAGQAWLTVDEVRDREGLDPIDAPARPTPSEVAIT